MNVQLNEKHLQILRDCNDNLFRYLVRDDYAWANEHQRKQPKLYETLDLWIDAPVSPEEQKLYIKVLGQGRRELSHVLYFFNPNVMGMPTDEFNRAYQERIIANHEGLKINFARHKTLLKLEQAATHKLDIDGGKHIFTLHSLYFFGVEYLLVDEYPIINPVGAHNGNTYMVVWVNPTEENAKRFRKASDYCSGNPPTVKEMCRNRRFVQGNVYIQTYYQSFDFNEYYQKRKIINYKGTEVHFAQL